MEYKPKPTQQDAIAQFTYRKGTARHWSSAKLRSGETIPDFKKRLAIDLGATDIAIHTLTAIDPRV